MRPGIFSLTEDNPPIPGCTVSGELFRNALIFSLAEGTDISPESYPVRKFWLALAGKMRVLCGDDAPLDVGDCCATPVDVPLGIAADTDSVYLEIITGKESHMNPVLKDKEVFALKDLVPYQEGKVVNMDLISQPNLKFVVMSFDAGTGLSEHAAPGEAMVFVLDGQGIIGYEGEEYTVKAGENFMFAKNGRHYVKADGKFKMALLLALE